MALRLRVVTVLSFTGWMTSWALAARPPARPPLRTFTGHTDTVRSLAFSPDGKTLATGEQLSTLSGHNGSIEAVAFDDDGKGLFSGANDGEMKLWNLAEATEIATLHMGRAVVSVAVSPDGKALAAGQGNGVVTLWNLREKLERRVLEGHRGAAFAVAFSPDSKTLASAGLDGTVKLSDVAGAWPALPRAKEHGPWPSRPTASSSALPATVRAEHPRFGSSISRAARRCG